MVILSITVLGINKAFGCSTLGKMGLFRTPDYCTSVDSNLVTVECSSPVYSMCLLPRCSPIVDMLPYVRMYIRTYVLL